MDIFLEKIKLLRKKIDMIEFSLQEIQHHKEKTFQLFQENNSIIKNLNAALNQLKTEQDILENYDQKIKVPESKLCVKNILVIILFIMSLVSTFIFQILPVSIILWIVDIALFVIANNIYKREIREIDALRDACQDKNFEVEEQAILTHLEELNLKKDQIAIKRDKLDQEQKRLQELEVFIEKQIEEMLASKQTIIDKYLKEKDSELAHLLQKNYQNYFEDDVAPILSLKIKTSNNQ